jgi:hypothetical protein
MMVQSYMQDEGKARGIHAWAGEWQKEHAKPPQVWSCVCVWVMVGVVKYLPLLMSPKIPSSTCRPALLLKTELHMHVQTHTQDCPKQFDGVSCGVFVCCFADCLSGDACLLRCAFSSLRHKF